jgi:hypothetical protein
VNEKGTNNLKDPEVDGSIMLHWMLQKYDVDLIQLAQDRNKWWAIVNTVMILWIPYTPKVGKFLDK